MSFDPHSTFAYSSIISVVSQAANVLVVNVTPGTGALFASPQQVTICPAGQQATMANAMIARLTGIVGDQLTISYTTANRESSGIRLVQVGDQIGNGITPKALTDIEAATGGGGGGAAWGEITGTLSDQTDLQTALNRATSVIATIDNINAKSIAVTPLYTVPAGKKLVIVSVQIRTTAFTSGSKSINAAGNIGKTGPDYIDYYDSGNLEVQKFTAVDQFFYIIPINAAENSGVPVPVYNAGDIINLSIATGSDATLETWSVDVLGYLL